MSRKLNLVGKRFGKLEVLNFIGFENGRSQWLCKCDCGNKKIMSSKNLLTNKAKSCGCLKDKGMKRGDVIKGACKDRLYKVYKSMIHRCYYPCTEAYHRYGGRGIVVCEEWLKSYNTFRDWALSNGYDYDAPQGQCTLDRINNDGNYEPNNCRWATIKQQANNTRRNHFIEYNGKTQTVSQWANELGVAPDSIFNRLQKGFTEEEALTLKFNERRKRC